MLADRFLTGDVAMKRLILTTIGSNLTLKDKKLSVELLHPFQLIRSELQDQKALDEALEPKKDDAIKGKTGTFVPVFPSLLPWASNLRTFFTANRVFVPI